MALVEVRHVTPTHQAQTLGCPEQAVDGGVGHLPGARRLQIQARGQAVEHVEHAPVGRQHDLFANVAGRIVVRGAARPMAIERTFSMIKPDATRRNITGKVVVVTGAAVARGPRRPTR